MFHSSDHHLIPFYLDDLDSLRRALTRYRVLLDDNDVMGGEYSFKVEFVEASVEPFRRLQVVDAQHNIELLKSSLDWDRKAARTTTPITSTTMMSPRYPNRYSSPMPCSTPN